ncbi:MAG: hypothetical protein JKY26_17580 [Pseudomonas sp.]|nr:hypothetical protein [Pseudomonas sp.]
MKELLRLFSWASQIGVSSYGLRQAQRRPLSRHRRDPKDPVQARRIAAAKAKRARKAAKLDRDIFECARRNLAHRHPVPGTRRVDALNPIFIAQ